MTLWRRMERLEELVGVAEPSRDIFVSWSSNDKEPEVESISSCGQTWSRKDGETVEQLKARAASEAPPACPLRVFFINHRA